jgi:hypothetical protein
MEIKLILIFLSLFGFSSFALAQDPPSGLDRSEGLALKAKLDYERKTQSKSEQRLDATPPVKKSIAPDLSLTAAGKVLSCKNGNEVRGLTLEYKGQGCELFYIKANQSKSQARQTNGATVCESVFEKMKTTLEKTGFVCEQKKD